VNPQTLQKVWLTIHTDNTTLKPQCRVVSNDVEKPIKAHKTFHQLTRGNKLWNVNFGLSFGVTLNGYKNLKWLYCPCGFNRRLYPNFSFSSSFQAIRM